MERRQSLTFVACLACLAMVACEPQAPPGREPSHDEVMQAMKKHRRAMQGCVAQQRKRDPSVTGTLEIGFTIEPSGQVGKVDILSQKHRGSYVAGCISYIVKSMRFPPFDGPPKRIERFPLRLSPGAAGKDTLEQTRQAPDEATRLYLEGDLDAAIAAASESRSRVFLARIKRLYEKGLTLASDPKELERAAVMFEQARKMDRRFAPEPGAFRKKIDKELARCLVTLGTDALARDDPKTRSILDRALECDPQSDQIRALLEKLSARAEQILAEARTLEKTDPARAEEKLTTVLRWAHEGEALFDLATERLRSQPGRDGGSSSGEAGKTAKEIRTEGIEAQKHGRFLEAIAKYRRAYALDPSDTDLLRFMGAAYAQKGERATAYEYYKRYVKACPECPYAPAIRQILKDYEDWTR
ncbi:MAG: AgmX/PglI C-terminal domain-containing protein [Deltaproteobacteria bacterium]|nr:AgmX/PglI C-terminal domain-containing protein [Deltaproteobacteria bacterium]